MKIRVAVNNISIDRKDRKKCGVGCPGLHATADGEVVCVVFNWKALKKGTFPNIYPFRCRACVLNQLPPKGVKRCR